MPPRDPSLARLARAARRAGLRSRLGDSCRRLGRWLPWPLLLALGALTYVKVARASLEVAEPLLLACAGALALVVGGAAAAGLGRRPPRHGAALLDRHHALEGRVASALEFRDVPADRRTPLMELAIDDALAVVRELSPRRAVPLRLPREAPLVVCLTAALAGVALLEVRTTRVLPAAAARIDPLVLTDDDLELFRDASRELEKDTRDPAVRAAIGRFNQLLEDVAARRLDRTEAFRRLAELERELEQAADASREARSEGLSAVARELEESALARPIARALQERRLRDAEQALRELAEKLAKQRGPPPTQAELERLREAVKRASEASTRRLEEATAREQKANEERQRLLRKKQDGKATRQDERALEKKERELERLGREKRRAEQAKREMSQLDRELQRAAEELMKDLGAGAEALRRGAEDLNRMAEEEMSDAEKRALKKRIEELRELLRQQGQAGRERIRQMQRFADKARGRAGAGESGEGGQEAPGQPGSEPGEGEQPGEGEGGEGKGARGEEGQEGEGEGASPGTGKGSHPGRGAGEGPGQLRIGRGPGGKSLRLEGRGERPGAGSEGGRAGGGTEPGQGSGRGGDDWGTGGGGDPRGDATEAIGEAQDVAAAGVDTGRGKASSQVIRGAAQRGFVGRGYRKVFRDYQHVAEEQMREDDIPPGYRFYVQRYFQLIRPRE